MRLQHLIRILVFLAAVKQGVSLSLSHFSITCNSPADRRNALTQIPWLSSLLLFFPTTRTNAACLSGDDSPDCIGFYKVPLDDAILPYVGTPEELAKFAPGLRWVPLPKPPKTYKDARLEMDSLQEKTIELDDVILKGRLEEAGIELLRLIPRVTLAGRFLIEVYATEETGTMIQPINEYTRMRSLRIEEALTDLLAILNTCDVMLGQALRNELGSTTSAQIQILAELRDAKSSWNEVQKAIPKDFQASNASANKVGTKRRKLWFP